MLTAVHSAHCTLNTTDTFRCSCGARSNKAPIVTLIHCIPGKPAVTERFPLTVGAK